MPPLDEAAMRDRVGAAGVARLATVGADARPHLVPLVFALDGERLCTGVDDKPKSSRRLRRFANVAGNRAVSVLVDHYEPDWARLWWVRLDGDAHAEPEVSDRWLALLAEKYPAYARAAPRGPFLIVEISRWTGWTATPGGS